MCLCVYVISLHVQLFPNKKNGNELVFVNCLYALVVSDGKACELMPTPPNKIHYAIEKLLWDLNDYS